MRISTMLFELIQFLPIRILYYCIILLLPSLASGFEIQPLEPTHCDPLTVTVQRNFSQDCNWQVRAVVTSTESEIQVHLDLSGSVICLQVPIKEIFSVQIGPFDPGQYNVSITWSDGLTPEEQSLTVTRGTCPTPGIGFRRGDLNGDGNQNIADGSGILNFLFWGVQLHLAWKLGT